MDSHDKGGRFTCNPSSGGNFGNLIYQQFIGRFPCYTILTTNKSKRNSQNSHHYRDCTQSARPSHNERVLLSRGGKTGNDCARTLGRDRDN